MSRLFHPRPISPSFDGANGLRANAVLAAEHRAAFTINQPRFDSSNLIQRQAHFPRHLSTHLASALHCIAGVGGMIAKQKVCGIDALTVVARMADKEPGRNGAAIPFKCVAVCSHALFPPPQHPVAIRIKDSGPFNAATTSHEAAYLKRAVKAARILATVARRKNISAIPTRPIRIGAARYAPLITHVVNLQEGAFDVN